MTDGDAPQAHEHHEHHDHEHIDYPTAVRRYRADKDEAYRTSPRSPVPEAERATFAGIPYFAIDEDLVFEELRLEPYTGDEPTSFQIPTTDGQLRPAERAGVLRFDVGGVPATLGTLDRVRQLEEVAGFVIGLAFAGFDPGSAVPHIPSDDRRSSSQR